jgi:26S proteasome regulatory subunit (ATPase 3-interacting protein)
MVPRNLSEPESEDAFPTLKPKTENARVTKPKGVAKPKVVKPKIEKVVKPKVVKSKTEKPPGVAKKIEKKAILGTGDEKKEKVKAVVGEEAEALLVEYLKLQNRPFSATEISANLHGKVFHLQIPLCTC